MLKIGVLLVTAVAAAVVMQGLHLPAAWFFGPLVVAVVFAVRGWSVPTVPRPAYVASQALIGTVLGASFSPDSLRLISGHATMIAVVIFSIFLTSLFNGWLLIVWTRLDPRTAFLGTMPGGAGEMAALSDSLEADTCLVTVMQYVRLLVILSSLFVVAPLLLHGSPVHAALAAAPVVAPEMSFSLASCAILLLLTGAGFFAGMKTKIPAGTFLVPASLYLILVLCGQKLGRWPMPVLAAAWMVMALRIGGQFTKSTIAAVKSMIFPVLSTTVLLLLGSAALSWWLAHRMHLDPVSAYLAATPGGLDSVAAVASGLQADCAIILIIHLSRLLSVLLIGPWLVRGCSRWFAGRTETSAARAESLLG